MQLTHALKGQDPGAFGLVHLVHETFFAQMLEVVKHIFEQTKLFQSSIIILQSIMKTILLNN